MLIDAINNEEFYAISPLRLLLIFLLDTIILIRNVENKCVAAFAGILTAWIFGLPYFLGKFIRTASSTRWNNMLMAILTWIYSIIGVLILAGVYLSFEKEPPSWLTGALQTVKLIKN